MPAMRVFLIDSDDDSAAWLLDQLRQQGFGDVTRLAPGPDLPDLAGRARPDLILLNHHFDRPGDLVACAGARRAAPEAVVVALAAAGPTLRQLRQWAGTHGGIDAVLEKPLAEGALRARLLELATNAQATQALQARAQRLARLVPEGAMDAIEGRDGGGEDMFAAAVLFTDVRRSSDLITRVAPRDYFRLLDCLLSAQAEQVRRFHGAVVKYTGDGLMAVFRGMARSHLALRCAAELAADPSQRLQPYGVGVAEGLVLAGLVGASGDPARRSQYDVVGATVHLAARLCAMAGPAEVVATRAAHAASRLHWPQLRVEEGVAVRGFPLAIDCVVFAPGVAHAAA
ncbi:MAG: adenylate/guanylate cyclase domain-containing protein [Comamonadaceae bacterium]|nr:MAG: adenylate/guanylate cyclase domain-containing protein [Comamonadaceae bacterium]